MIQSASASQAHFRIAQVCPVGPGAEQLVVFLRSKLMRSLLTFCSFWAGSGEGLSSKTSSTAGGLDGNKCCERMSETSACVWTRPTMPCNEGTLFNQ